MEKPLVVTLGGFNRAESKVTPMMRGEDYTIIPRSGGRLEFRLTGQAATVLREVCERTGASPNTVLFTAMIASLGELL